MTGGRAKIGTFSRIRRRALAAGVAMAIGVGLGAPASSGAAADSQGQDFWVAFIGNFQGQVTKTLFITGAEPASGTVEVPGLGFSQNFTVTPGTITPVVLPSAAELTVEEGTQAVAAHVTADHEVTVYGLSRQQFTTDAFLALPTDVLGTQYLPLGYPKGCCRAEEFGVAATEDNTTVTIVPKVDATGGHAAGVPYNIVLNRGDAYQLRAAVSQTDLSGSEISSDRPISVFAGHQCANIPDTNSVACDHVVEAIPPTSSWGTNFGTVPLKTRTRGDTVRVLASEDNTTVSINDAVAATLNRGQIHQQLIDGVSTINADKPVLVAQYSNSSSFDGVTSDPFEMLIVPLEQFLIGSTVATPDSGFAQNFINLVVPDSDIGNVAVDGTPVPAAAFTPIGSTGFSGAQVDVSLGTHNLTGTQPFGPTVYGFDSFDSYGYPGGQSFAPVARVASLTLKPPTATHLIATNQCATAELLDSNGNPVPDVRIDFSVAGANPLAAASLNADANGQANLCYVGANAGDDTITATQGNLTATATKSWVQTLPGPPPSVFPEGCGLTIDGVDLLGDNAKNTLSGTARTDRLRGSGEADTLGGEGAPDCLRGQEGADQISGDDGGDIIRGGADDDNILGEDGADNIRLQNGQDKVDGGAGDDSIKAQGRGSDNVKCGDGNDSVVGDVKDKIANDCEKVKIVNPH